jgi:hypothetical protein
MSYLPAFPIVQKAPIVLIIFYLASVLDDLGKQFTEEVVVRGFFKPKFPYVLQVYTEFLYGDDRRLVYK